MAYTSSQAIGEVTEVTGEAKIIRADGTEEPVILGTEVYEGDIIETEGASAVNIGFVDESSFAVSSDARIAIDEFVFDPASESGAQDFSVLRGVFMYTSGLIGRENPDSVEIDTPVGSIGIRGTIIGGNINPDGQSDVTVIEGAIVVRNEAGERLLSTQYDTVSLNGINHAPSEVRTLSVHEVANNYGAVKDVSAELFSSFNDQMQQEGPSDNLDESSVNDEVSDDAQDAKDNGENPSDDIQMNDGNNQQGENKVELKTLDGQKEGKEIGEKSGQDHGDKPAHDFARGDERDNNPNAEILKKFSDTGLHFETGGNVDENATGGTVVGRVAPTQTLQFDIRYTLTNDAGGMFEIDPRTGVVSLASGVTAPDFETAGNTVYDIRVQATRVDSGASRSFDLHLNLNDVNESAQISGHTTVTPLTEIDTGLTADQVITTLNFAEVDTNTAFKTSFSVSDSRFEVRLNGSTYELVAKTGAVFDYESESSVTVSIHQNDGGNSYADHDVTININNLIDEAPTDITASNHMIAENPAIDDVVAVLTTTDTDAGDSFTYTIIGGDTNGAFKIVGDEIQIADATLIDFETVESYDLTIQVTDSNGHNYQKVVTIDIQDINEASSITGHSNIALPENDLGLTADTVVADLDFVEADTNSGFRTHFTVSDSRFAVQMLGGTYHLVALAGQVFDHDTEGSVVVSISQNDGTNSYTDYNVTVMISDINDELPTNISVTGNTVLENVADNHVVANLITTDGDATDTHTYSIVSGNGDNIFAIDGDKIIVQDSSNLDFETTTSYDLEIQVTDGAGHTYNKIISIGVLDFDEPATLDISGENILISGEFGVQINESGALVGLIDVADPEGQDFNSSDFTISGAANNFFEIVKNGDDYEVRLKDGFRIEQSGSIYQITDGTQTENIASNGKYSFSVSLSGGDAPLAINMMVINPDSTNAGGSPSNDVFTIYHEHSVAIAGGAGQDKVILDGAFKNGTEDIFDLRTINTQSANGAFMLSVEEIQINGNGSAYSNDINNTLRLNISQLSELFASSDGNMIKISTSTWGNKVEFYDGGSKESLLANGYTGVDLNGGGNGFDSNDYDAQGFYHFQHSNGVDTLLIDKDIIGAAGGGSV